MYRRRPDRRINIHWLERPQYAQRRASLWGRISTFRLDGTLSKTTPSDGTPLKLNADSVIKRFSERSRNRKGSQVVHVPILPGDGASSEPRSE